ncbi:MAG TPA: hypothetical protein VK116_14830, partial [Planctomycetota bacterium]|nr:hypothetical protein [Planctomycetota bacterium]
MSEANGSKRPAIRFLFENSLFLIGGAVVALVWANVDLEGYNSFVQTALVGSNESAHPINLRF